MNSLDDEERILLLREILKQESDLIHQGKAKIKHPRIGRKNLLNALHTVISLLD